MPQSAPSEGSLWRHPLFLTLTGFVLTGILGTTLTWWLNLRSHQQDVQSSIRDAAIASVSDISDLVNERRERGALVISAIRRAAPEGETSARKLAYDEAYVRWNAKIPADILRMRAGLRVAGRLNSERYIDGLTNIAIMQPGITAESLLRGPPPASKQGLFSIMDACLTRAYDAYRANGFTPSDQITGVIASCRFPELYSQSVACFSIVGEALYSAVNTIGDTGLTKAAPITDDQVLTACTPP